MEFLNALKGGFFLRKKPLECVPSVYSNSENAVRQRQGMAMRADSLKAAYV
jgi:hypothetical protein